MELRTLNRRARLLQWSEAHVDEWLGKPEQPFPVETKVNSTQTVRHVRRWENALLDATQELLWYLRGQRYFLREVTAKRWKGGWLIILQARAGSKGHVKGFAFGETLTLAISDLWYKASQNAWKWRDE